MVADLINEQSNPTLATYAKTGAVPFGFATTLQPSGTMACFQLLSVISNPLFSKKD